MSVFIDHWLPFSLTNSLTHCRSVDLIDVTLTGVDVNSKLVDVVTVADVDDEDDDDDDDEFSHDTDVWLRFGG